MQRIPSGSFLQNLFNAIKKVVPMSSDFKKNLNIRYRRFRRWIKSEQFTIWVYRIIAILVIGIMVLSGFIVML